MKTCKYGCGKMKSGGSVKKVKKMADGGSTGLVGMPRYSNNPRSEQGRILKKGGPIKKMKAGGSSNPCPKGYHWEGGICRENTLHSLSSKIGVGTTVAGALGIAGKAIVDKIKTKKAEKEKTKKEAETSKAKFGASVNVKSSCKKGMVRSADGNCVMERPKFKSGGSFGMLSVKAGIDKNPKPTAADRIAGAKMNKKKMGGTTRKK
jgi:hypothetical protein